MNRRRFLGAGMASAATLVMADHASKGVEASIKEHPVSAVILGTAHSHSSGKARTVQKLQAWKYLGAGETHEAKRNQLRDKSPWNASPVFSIEEALRLPELEAVIVEGGIHELVPLATLAVERGLHVHMDKPPGVDLAPFQAFLDLVEKKQVQFQMGYMLRYNPAFQLARKAVKEGWFGDILEIDATMGKLADASLRKELSEFSGAGMFELACHLVDRVVDFLGKPKSIHAFHQASWDGSTEATSTLPDNQLAVLEYDKAIVTLRCNHADPFGGPRRAFTIAGTKGFMEIAPLESNRIRLGLSERRGEFSAGISEHVLPSNGERFDEELRDFASWIRAKSVSAWSKTHDLLVHQTVLKISGMLD